ncbi:MAG TPA: deoxyribose-phosphate aldolase [Planctomycetota bacterium]|jgi:deoxyribose-phosphate aldolase
MLTKEEVAKKIDHAVLKPNQTDADIVKNAKMCMARGVGSLCVRPSDVKLAAETLKGSSCVASCVIGFPHGANKPETKAFESKLAIEDGAKELDMVLNIGKFLSGDLEWCKRDIAGVVDVAKPKGVLVKVILETCLLKPEQVAQACKIAEAAGADFVKTSTGFNGDGANPEVIDIMMKTVGKTMKVKASGGVRTWEVAIGYLKQGCSRLGVASTEAVLDGAKAEGNY